MWWTHSIFFSRQSSTIAPPMKFPRTIIITGITGFLGSQLAAVFIKSGWRVIGVSRNPRKALETNRSIREIEVYSWDHFLSGSRLHQCLTDSVIVHTATNYGRRNTAEFDMYHSNVSQPLKFLLLCLKSGSQCFINTDTFYPPEFSIYARNKREFLDSAREISRSYSTCFINLRLHHVYGMSDNHSKFFPWLIHRCLRHLPCDLTSGNQLRSFICITDVVEAFRLVINSPIKGDYIFSDVATTEYHSLADLILMIHTITNSRSVLRFGAIPYQPGETFHPRIDSGYLFGLGWSPRIPLFQGLKDTVKWEIENADLRESQYRLASAFC